MAENPPVRRRNFTLPDDLAALLEAEADTLGVSASELCREAVVLRLALAAVVRSGTTGDVLPRILAELPKLLTEIERIERRRERKDRGR